jgi:hypothetical protein
LALVVGLLAGGGGVYAWSQAGQSTLATLTYGPGGDMPTFEGNFGYCYLVTPGPGRSLDSGAYRECTDPHDSQIFGIVDAYSSSVELSYPGEDALRETGNAFCRMYFDTAVQGEDKSALTVTLVIPSQQAFEEDTRSPGATNGNYATRSLYCVLSATNGQQVAGSRLAPAFES